MKIVLISPAHPLRGGIAASSERLAQALQEQGHEVVLYSFRVQYPSFLFPGKSQYTDDPAPAGLRIETKLNSVNPLNWLFSGIALAREKADLVIVRFWLPFMGPCLGTVLRVARFWSRKKFRVNGLVDNIVPHEKRPGDRAFARYFVRACNDFVVMSRSVGQEIIGFLPAAKRPLATERNVRFAPHPIYDSYGKPVGRDTARHELGLAADARVVLFFGFIRAYKGLDLLLHALAQTPSIQAIIAGEPYEDWSRYQSIIEQHQLGDRVHVFTDFIPADRVRYYFCAADLVVQPYKTATQSGISQIAYHFEKPMIVTDVGGLPEIVTHGVSGYVVAPDAAAIAAAMHDFFEKQRAASMLEGVRQEKKRFSWDNLVQAILGEY
ncbi:MAG: glycosyltransferase [Saprospiraceae bacterium]|nr:glycosyltransferase [Saprospiraceae bacterium]MCC7504592.1 glycosyltransferase [Saprospiraceae bacterium]